MADLPLCDPVIPRPLTAKEKALRGAEMVNAAGWLVLSGTRGSQDRALALAVLAEAVPHVDRDDGLLGPIVAAADALLAVIAAHGWDKATWQRLDLERALAAFFRWRCGEAQAALRAQEAGA